ncbi:MAG: hypothetical protein QM767_18255 [Anaeromyxobacter sp.]
MAPVLALALCAVPLAVAALAVAAARPLGRPERAVIGGGLLVAASSALLAPQLPLHDAWAHYQHLRAALAEPARLLDPWDRPGFTLVYAGPAALGWTAARLASLAPAALAAVATARAARALGLPRPWLVALLLLAQPDVLGQASSTMTELPAAAALAVAAWGWAERRSGLCAAGLGWLGVARPEGALLAGLGALGLWLRPPASGEPRVPPPRRLAPAALALAPLLLHAAVGGALAGDPLWIVRANPYRGLVGLRLEAAQVLDSFFVEALRRGQPPALLVLEAAGAAAALAGAPPRCRFLLPPLAACALVLTFARIGPSDDWRESRYLVAVAPALALLAAEGLPALLARLPRLAPPLLLALAAHGAAGLLLWHWRFGPGSLPGAGPALVALLLAAALALWRAPRLVPLPCALALLLILPVAAAPPGALARHRLEPDRPRGVPRWSTPPPGARRVGEPPTRPHARPSATLREG